MRISWMCWEEVLEFIGSKKQLTRKQLLKIFLQYMSKHEKGGDLMTTKNGEDWLDVTSKDEQIVIKDFLKAIDHMEIQK